MTNKRIKQSTVEASEWFAALCEGELSPGDRERFLDWLRESPAHVEEYLELARLWDEMGDVEALRHVDAESELVKARNIVMALDGASEVGKAVSSKGRTVKRPYVRLSVAAGLLVAVAVGWWAVAFDSLSNGVTTTAVGEQRSMTLDDGSVISLNTQTSVRVAFVDGERHAELLRGEALFDVARDERRPFVVVAGAAEVRVLGTTFNVYREDDRTATVTVLEGRVAVTTNDTTNSVSAARPTPAPESPGSAVPVETMAAVELTQGQQARIGRSGAVVEPAAVNVEKAVAWTDRRLIFENSTLEEVLAEFNRYNTRELSVDDPALAALKLNGVFESHDPESLLQYLERAYGVQVRDDDDQRILEPK